MKRLIIFIMAILLACSLTACKSPSQAVSEKVSEKILEEASGNKVDINGDKVTVKGQDGTEVILGGTEWPRDKLGKEIPKIGKGTVTYVANSDTMCMIMVEKVKQDEFENYLSLIKKDGFTENEVNYSDAAITSYMADNSKGIGTQLTYDSEKEELSITVGKQEQ